MKKFKLATGWRMSTLSSSRQYTRDIANLMGAEHRRSEEGAMGEMVMDNESTIDFQQRKSLSKVKHSTRYDPYFLFRKE